LIQYEHSFHRVKRVNQQRGLLAEYKLTHLRTKPQDRYIFIVG